MTAEESCCQVPTGSQVTPGRAGSEHTAGDGSQKQGTLGGAHTLAPGCHQGAGQDPPPTSH